MEFRQTRVYGKLANATVDHTTITVSPLPGGEPLNY